MRLQPLAACYLLLRDDRTRSLRSIHLAIRLRSAIVSARGTRGFRVNTQEHAGPPGRGGIADSTNKRQRRNWSTPPTGSNRLPVEDYNKLCGHTSQKDSQKMAQESVAKALASMGLKVKIAPGAGE